jgi:hypothetical protein
MAIVAECPICGKRFKADEKQAGKKAKCSQCATVFVVGVPATEALVSQASAAPSAPTKTPRRESDIDTDLVPPPPATMVEVKQVVPAPAPPPVADIPATPAPAPARSPRRRGKLVGLVAVLAIAGGAAAVVVPNLPKSSSSPSPARNASANDGAGKSNQGGAQTVSMVVAPTLPPTSPAWSAEPDVPQTPLVLPDDFRLTTSAQSGMRYVPGSVTLAALPSPFAAVSVVPDAGRAAAPPAPIVEIWNLATRHKVGQIKLAAPLAKPVLSQDGGYYAGQIPSADDAATAPRPPRLEVWSTSTGQRVHSIDGSAAAIVGFPVQDQIAVVGDKLQVFDLSSRSVVREVALPAAHAAAEDTRAAASARFKLVAVANSKSLTLIDLAQGQVLGTAQLPPALVAHPRRTLSLRAMDFSPDGTALALVFDNRQSTRRIAVFDVASGRLKELISPAAPVYDGGPDFQWAGDGKAFLVGSGILIGRDSGRQIGEIYGDLADEGLGGVLAGVLPGGQALIAWDKFPRGLVLRSVPVRREMAEWINIELTRASATRYEQLQCFSLQFGNGFPRQTINQAGRLADSSQFLVVDAEFTATLAQDAPDLLPFRHDQFALIADGQARPPIGTLSEGGTFTLEKPTYTLTKNLTSARKPSIVFAVTGRERSLALRVGSAQTKVEMPAQVVAASDPALLPVPAERVNDALFVAPDDGEAATVRVNFARLGPFEMTPDVDEAPLKVTYSSSQLLLAVNFDLTVNATRGFGRNVRAGPGRVGLLLADGTLVQPSAELPGPLPLSLQAGEHRTQTCLFVLTTTPGRYRLVYDGVPVATVKPDPPTARSIP